MDNVDYNIYLKTFGNNLRKIRVQQVISQSQLGFETNLSREYINRLENGKINVSLKNIIAISKALNIKEKELLNFE